MENNNSEHLRHWYNRALLLSVITIAYNLAEGIISGWFGFRDETITLWGFGADSFIEVASGAGIFYMVLRLRDQKGADRSRFEKNALYITGGGFIVLTVVLILTAIFNFITGQKPETTVWGVIISLISIASMVALMKAKEQAGRQLNSKPILADAKCTRMCIYMSVVLLVASLLYMILPVTGIDSLGALALAYLSAREGKECFDKAKNVKECSCH